MPIHPESHRRAEQYQDSSEPHLRMGDYVTLNSGGPFMIVVDNQHESHVVAAWRDGSGAPVEASFPRRCVHRVSPV